MNKLVLQGRALPYRPLTFEGSMRAEFTWYPGTTAATVQVLGPEEGRTSINGMWKDRFIKTTTAFGLPVFGQTGFAYYNGGTLGDVASLVKAVDAFRRRGQLIEVKWDEITRHGILTKFRHTWLRREDVEWEMEFSWMSQGEAAQPVAFATTLRVVDLANEILAQIQAVKDTIDEIKAAYSMIASVVNLVNDAITAIEEAAAAVADMANQAVKAVTSAADTARHMVAALETVKDQALNIAEAFQSVPDRLQRAGMEIEDVTQALALESSYRNRKARRLARQLRALAARRQYDALANTDQQAPIAIFTAQEGQDLRDVSLRYYDTPDQWRQLAGYNGFKGSLLHAGNVVIVPPMTRLGA